jgi:ACT domain-containing protein
LPLTKVQNYAGRQAKTLELNLRQISGVDADRPADKVRVACYKINILLVNQNKVYDGQATSKSSQVDGQSASISLRQAPHTA